MSVAVTGYVLAGGQSSRMGQDKALLELGGRPLVARAVETLRVVAGEVYVLSSRPELAAFAPLVPDIHPGCGPLGGIEAGLRHTCSTWNIFLAVDMPFIPEDFVADWVRRVVASETARVALFTVERRPQPALCLLHREVRPFVELAVAEGAFKLYPVLAGAAGELAAGSGVGLDEVLLILPAEDGAWFANLNTTEEFAAAERGYPSPLERKVLKKTV